MAKKKGVRVAQESVQEIAPEKELQEQPVKEVRRSKDPDMRGFYSRRSGLRIVIKPGRFGIDARGERFPIAGHTIQFVEGYYETKDQVEIDAIKKDPFYGIDIISADGLEDNTPRPGVSAEVRGMRLKAKEAFRKK